MPSSSDEVATSARSAPALRRSSTSTRCARASEPWCDRTSVSPASSFSAPASRSASRRLLTKISVERCARMSSSRRGWMAAQIDGRASPTVAAGPLGISIDCGQLRHVLDRHFDGQLERFLLPGVDDGDRPVADAIAWIENSLLRSPRPPTPATADVPRGRCGRASQRRRGTARPRRADAASPRGRCAAADRLHSALEPLERQREVRAALGRHQRVNLVDDDRVDRAQRLARVRGQQQIQRLRRRDQDVGGLALEARALGLRRVAGADGDCRRDVNVAAPVCDLGDAGQRRAQVALDVDRERLERRHVEHAAALGARRRRVEHQPIEAPEERGQRLAAAGRREDQRRFAARDRGPAERLRSGRRLEGVERTSRGVAGWNGASGSNRRTDAHFRHLIM